MNNQKEDSLDLKFENEILWCIRRLEIDVESGDMKYAKKIDEARRGESNINHNYNHKITLLVLNN